MELTFPYNGKKVALGAVAATTSPSATVAIETIPKWRRPMRFTFALLLSVAISMLLTNRLLAEEYLTKEGRLAQPLKVVQLQGGFAGYTGMQFTIAPEGTWTSETVFNQKITPKDKGKLSEKELAKLGAILKKYDLAGLPAESGKKPGANPHTITFEFGKQTASLVGQVPPQLDPKDPTGTVESRFAGILEGVAQMLTPPVKAEEKK